MFHQNSGKLSVVSIVLVLLCVLISNVSAIDNNNQVMSVKMPHVFPTEPETYFCAVFPLDKAQKKFIVGFEPKASMKIAHHILLYGCKSPGLESGYWNCGGMHHGSHHGHEKQENAGGSDPEKIAGVCQSEQKIIYAWARDAPRLDLPEGVAFEIGGNTDINYLVLQVHYSDLSSFVDGRKDDSGVILHYTETPQPKIAGVAILSTGGMIPPNKTENLEVACLYEESTEMHPFRFRTHTHNLGKLVSGYKVTRERKGDDHWTKIGSRNPLDPQMFYPVEKEVTIRKGDILAARCTMHNEKQRPTYIGPTNKDEMCNFYIMFWYESGMNPIRFGGCGSPGAPEYYWATDPDEFNNIPQVQDQSEPESIQAFP